VGGTTDVPTANFVNQVDAYLNGTYTTYFTGGPGPGTFTPDEAFLNQAYLDILGRRYDAVGYFYWIGLMQQGMSREEVMQAIENSAECQARKINLAYHDMLGRDVDVVGFAAWSNMLRNGGTMVDVQASIAASAEFSSGSDFLDKLYNRALNHAVDAVGRSYWNAQLAAGASRYDVAHAIYSSAEFRGLEVTAYYENFLDRAPETAGLNYWIAILVSGRDDLVRAGFIGSLEFYQHVNPT
jgi:hypothetical protein